MKRGKLRVSLNEGKWLLLAICLTSLKNLYIHFEAKRENEIPTLGFPGKEEEVLHIDSKLLTFLGFAQLTSEASENECEQW